MSRRPAAFTEEEVKRFIRAARAEQRPHVRLYAADGKAFVEIPTVDSAENTLAPSLPPKPEGIVL